MTDLLQLKPGLLPSFQTRLLVSQLGTLGCPLFVVCCKTSANPRGSYATPPMLLALSLKTGFVYAALSVPTCILMWLYIPETKGYVHLFFASSGDFVG